MSGYTYVDNNTGLRGRGILYEEGDWIRDAKWYASVVEQMIARSRQWWCEQRWRQTPWALRRGLGSWFEGMTVEAAMAFFSRDQHQGPVVYAWGPADGRGEDVYIGSSTAAMFAGAGKSDRAWSHLSHVRRHLRKECKCKTKLYRAAVDAQAWTSWILVPVAVLQQTTDVRVLRRLELAIIKRVAPRLNTIGVTWHGRDCRVVSKTKRRRPAQRGRGRGRHQGSGASARAIATGGCDPTTIVTWSSAGKMTEDFAVLLRDIQQARATGQASSSWCTWQGGGAAALSGTNWVSIHRRFGRTRIAIWCRGVLHVERLEQLPRFIRCERVGQVWVGELEVTLPLRAQQRRWVERLVHSVGKHDHSKEALIFGCQDAVLLRLWHAGLANINSGGARVITVVKRLMLQRHALKLRRSYVLRIPTLLNAELVKVQLRELIVWALRRRQLPTCWIDEIAQRVRIVFAARPSVGDMLDNHVEYANKFKQDEPFACTCQNHAVRALYRGTRPIGEHLRVKLSECGSSTMERVSAVGSGYIPQPKVIMDVREVLSSIEACAAGILATSTHRFTNGWGATGRKMLRAIVTTGCKTDSPQEPARAVHVHEVEEVKRLVAGLVVSPLDRNGKDRLLECAASYHAGYRATFWTPDYVECTETEAQILTRWCATAEVQGWTKLAKLPPTKSQKIPGTSYTMRKNKDFEPDSAHAAAPRCRPLTPYGGKGRKRHPLWRQMKMAGSVLKRALMDAGLRCWHLWATHHFPDSLVADQEELRALDPDGRTVLFAFDVKNMFTCLDKTAVVEAVTWIIECNPGWERARTAAGRGSRYPRGAYVARGASNKFTARVGSGLHQQAGEMYLPLKMVLDLVRFDLRESVMRCGQHLLSQKSGVPMGSFLSALLAGITVAVSEHRFYARLPRQVADRVRGRRYADDGCVAIREGPGAPTAAELFSAFASGCYPAPLELEVEQHKGQFKLLESTVYQEGETVAVLHRLKNWSETNPEGTGKFRVWTGRDSWGARRRGLLVGLLTRAYRSCSHRGGNGFNVVLAITRALVEAQFAGRFSWRQLLRTLTYMSQRRPEEFMWTWLTAWLTKIGRRHRNMWLSYLKLKRIIVEPAALLLLRSGYRILLG